VHEAEQQSTAKIGPLEARGLLKPVQEKALEVHRFSERGRGAGEQDYEDVARFLLPSSMLGLASGASI
jgi:hypothetical protein